jgi:aspartyl-tRNA(Asn)/glutamyl-tRNA(Gln) amidotransferase subunit A
VPWRISCTSPESKEKIIGFLRERRVTSGDNWFKESRVASGRTNVLTSIVETSEQLRKRALSPVELTKNCLAQIEKLNPTLNAFITVTGESALAQAQAAEAEILRGNWRGPLHGIPLAMKDLIDTAGIRTTAASALFKDRMPAEDAEIVRRLKDAGAVLLGKQNLHECAYGGSSMISYYGEVHNPWDPARIAGGSSGGSAASVAAGLGYGAIGTDTAGSVREPAALCGIVGLKPTYGRVSVRGVIPLSLSLDHVGPIARTVSDAAVMLKVIAGYDSEDAHSVNKPVPDYLASIREGWKPARIGVPRKFFYEDLDPEVAAAVNRALGTLRALASDLVEIEIEVPTDRTVQTEEAYAYHAEFVSRSRELYQPETLRRIRKGEGITSVEFERRREELQQIRSEIRKVFAEVDVLVTPTTPVIAPAIDELKQNPDLLRPRELLLLRNTRPVNVWGLPAISVPCGFTTAGLPIGLQIIGPLWREDRVLQLAYAYEQAADWHRRSPKLVEA